MPDDPATGDGSDSGNDLITPTLETPDVDDSNKDDGTDAKPAAMGKMKTPRPEEIVFKDKVESNAALIPKNLDELVFTDKHGKKIALADFKGKQERRAGFYRGIQRDALPFLPDANVTLDRQTTKSLKRSIQKSWLFIQASEIIWMSLLRRR